MSSSRDDRHTFVDFDGLDGDVTAEEPRAAEARFRVDDEIARGGLGRVHRGYDLALDREVAIKALLKASPAARARFERETLLTARLQHPNIVPVYDGGRDADGEPYLAMRLVHGASLTEAIDGRPSLEERLDLLPHVIDVCNAIAYAHSQRIAHRDLKPDNILVGDFGEAVVIDWGIAKDLDAEDDPTAAEVESPTITGLSSHSTLTRVGSVVGTPAYMPPEQAAGQSVEERADVYALGAVLYHMLAGVRPYQDAEDTLASVLAGPPVPVDSITPGVPPDLVAIVDKAMARLPNDRYVDAREFARDLNRFRKGRFVSAYAYTPRERIVRYVRAHPVSIGLSVALALAVVGGVVGLGWSHTVVEAERAAAVEARDEVAALRVQEQVQLDELTLEQARLVMLDRPAEAIRLLDTLSKRAVFDGRVRSVAAAAYALHPPVRMESPLKGGSHVAALDGDHVVLADGHGVALHDARGWRVVPLPGEVTDIEFWEGALLLCTSDGALSMDWEQATPRPVTSTCRTMHRYDSGVAIGGVEQSSWFDGEVTTFSHEASTAVLSVDGRRWWVFVRGEELLEYVEGAVVSRRPAGGSYAVGVSPDGRWVVKLHESPALEVVDVTSGEGQFVSIETGLDWLVVAAGVGPDAALVGGAGQEVVAVDLVRRTTLARVEVEGSPQMMQSLPNDQVFVVTDAGRAYVVELVDGRLDARAVSTTGRKLLSLGRDGQDLVFVERSGGLFRQRLDLADGNTIHRYPGRIDGMLVDGEDLWLHGTGGVQQLRAGTVVSSDDRVTEELFRCGPAIAVRGPDHVGFWGQPTLTTRDRPTVSRCVEGTLVMGTTTGQFLTWRAGEEPRWGSVGFRVRGVHALEGDALLVGPQESVLLDLSTDTPTPMHTYPERSVLFSTVRGDDVVYVTEDALLDNGIERQTLDSKPYALASGEHLWLGDVEGQILGWRDLGAPPLALSGHRQYVHVLRESRDHTRLASGGWDEMAWLFDIRDPTKVSGRPLPGHQAAVLAVAWSADGRTLYTGDHTGHVRSWRDDLSFEPAQLRRQVRALNEAIHSGSPLPQGDDLEAL